jgi:hypothetical protein
MIPKKLSFNEEYWKPSKKPFNVLVELLWDETMVIPFSEDYEPRREDRHPLNLPWDSSKPQTAEALAKLSAMTYRTEGISTENDTLQIPATSIRYIRVAPA